MAGTYQYSPDGDRRSELIDATLDCIAELGLQATTVRAVAGKAGVSIGLIRHHFDNKANLIFAAYCRTMDLITSGAYEALISQVGTPQERLKRFVHVALGGQASDYRMFSLWATFISQMKIDQNIADYRRQVYDKLRDATEQLLQEIYETKGQDKSQNELARLAMISNAVLDGLWIEASLDQSGRSTEQMIELGISTLEVLLGIAPPDE